MREYNRSVLERWEEELPESTVYWMLIAIGCAQAWTIYLTYYNSRIIGLILTAILNKFIKYGHIKMGTHTYSWTVKPLYQLYIKSLELVPSTHDSFLIMSVGHELPRAFYQYLKKKSSFIGSIVMFDSHKSAVSYTHLTLPTKLSV